MAVSVRACHNPRVGFNISIYYNYITNYNYVYIYIYYKYIMYISIYIYIYRLTVLEVLNQPRMKAIKDCFFIGSLTPVCHPSHGEPARILFFVVSHSYSCYMLLSWPPGMVDSN